MKQQRGSTVLSHRPETTDGKNGNLGAFCLVIIVISEQITAHYLDMNHTQ